MNEKAKHTPPPWDSSGPDYNGRRWISTGGGLCAVAMVPLRAGKDGAAERDANALLIAAAPELADALFRLMRTGSEAADYSKAMEQGLQALRKAGRL